MSIPEFLALSAEDVRAIATARTVEYEFPFESVEQLRGKGLSLSDPQVEFILWRYASAERPVPSWLLAEFLGRPEGPGLCFALMKAQTRNDLDGATIDRVREISRMAGDSITAGFAKDVINSLNSQ